MIHDPDLYRLHGIKKLVSDTNLCELKQLCPLVPTLEEVLHRYGKKLHLMVEVKEELYPKPEKQVMILKKIFSDLYPSKDFHLISLSPQMLEKIDFLENSAKILVAEFNVNELSRIAIEKKYAGIAGHYILLGNTVVTMDTLLPKVCLKNTDKTCNYQTIHTYIHIVIMFLL